MRIIRKGPAWELTTNCYKCSSLLVLEEADITLEPAGTRVEDYGKTCWHCPVCGTVHDLNVPEHVKRMATDKAEWNVGQPM